MLLRPHMGTYYSLLQLAGRGVSFDGMLLQRCSSSVANANEMSRCRSGSPEFLFQELASHLFHIQLHAFRPLSVSYSRPGG